jgi:hypothetical protein
MNETFEMQICREYSVLVDKPRIVVVLNCESVINLPNEKGGEK